MSERLFLIDVSNLAYRSFYAMRGLEAEGVGTAVLYGVLRDIIQLRERFGEGEFLFAFDRGSLLRKKLCPEYKEKRRAEEDDEKKAARQEVFNQIKELRTNVLPSLGYQNLIGFKGYEADDVIAGACEAYPTARKLVVGSDGDLYQLLSTRTSIWSPVKKTLITKETFEAKYGIDPSLWGMVKAIAGCTSDNVQGVPSVGDVTAVKYVTGLMTSGAKYDSIVKSRELIDRNLRLVQLPFEGLPKIEIKRSRVDREAWKMILRRHKITTLRYS